jgi:hypothetical protein
MSPGLFIVQDGILPSSGKRKRSCPSS